MPEPRRTSCPSNASFYSDYRHTVDRNQADERNDSEYKAPTQGHDPGRTPDTRDGYLSTIGKPPEIKRSQYRLSKTHRDKIYLTPEYRVVGKALNKTEARKGPPEPSGGNCEPRNSLPTVEEKERIRRDCEGYPSNMDSASRTMPSNVCTPSLLSGWPSSSRRRFQPHPSQSQGILGRNAVISWSWTGGFSYASL